MKPNIETMLAQHNVQISAVVTHHLNLEALLEELLKRHLANPDALDFERMMFAQKLSLCRAIGVVPKEVFELLKKLNALRNKFAHKLGFSPTYEEILALAKLAGEAGIDFSDGVDALSVEGAKELGYDEYTLLEKLFQNTLMDVIFMQEDDFANDFFSAPVDKEKQNQPNQQPEPTR